MAFGTRTSVKEFGVRSTALCSSGRGEIKKEVRRIFAEKQVKELTVFQVPMIEATGLVVHGFSTRLGGVSTGAFQGLDLGIYQGDDLEAVQRNRQLFVERLGIDRDQVVCMHQVHGLEVAMVGGVDGGRGFLTQETALQGTDGLMTNEQGVALLACFADCVPLFFLDPVKKAIAVSHAGWKGTLGGIGAITVARMGHCYGSRPEDILVGIGPSIGACHYEVDENLIEKTKRAFDFWPSVLQLTKGGHGQLDLWEANRLSLLKAGVLPGHITLSGLCTACRQDMFYSFRGSGGTTGRMAAVMMLK